MDYIRQKVNLLINENMTCDPVELAKTLGIEICLRPFSQIKGMFISICDKPVIILNSMLTENMRKFVIAHELGHYLLSPMGAGYFFITQNTLMETKIESEANRFAVELLTVNNPPAEGETIEQYANRIGIPKGMNELLKQLSEKGEL